MKNKEFDEILNVLSQKHEMMFNALEISEEDQNKIQHIISDLTTLAGIKLDKPMNECIKEVIEINRNELQERFNKYDLQLILYAIHWTYSYINILFKYSQDNKNNKNIFKKLENKLDDKTIN